MVERHDESGTLDEAWPALPLDDWADTYATLHMFTQVVGKVRLARAPMVNHWWHVTLYVTSRGLTTGPIPDGQRTFQIGFDLVGEASGGGSDGNFVAHRMPTLDGLGADGDGAHTLQEHILISSLVPRMLLMRRLMETLD